MKIESCRLAAWLGQQLVSRSHSLKWRNDYSPSLLHKLNFWPIFYFVSEKIKIILFSVFSGKMLGKYVLKKLYFRATVCLCLVDNRYTLKTNHALKFIVWLTSIFSDLLFALSKLRDRDFAICWRIFACKKLKQYFFQKWLILFDKSN